MIKTCRSPYFNGIVGIKKKLKNIVEFLKNQNADIICLQELTIDNPDQDIRHAPQYIAERLGYHYYYKDLSFESTGAKLANAIVSRFPISKPRFVWINEPTGTGKYDDEYRALIEVDVNVHGKTVTIGTTHMSYTHQFEITPRKTRETDALVDAISSHRKNYIFTGDLNAMPGSYTINNIAKFLKNVGPDITQATWTTKPFSYDGFEETELKWRLDYIFATDEIKVISAEILNTDYSDHLPILAKFELD